MILAVVCLLIAACGVNFPNPRFNMLAWGLFFWALTVLLGFVNTAGVTIKH